MFEFKKAMQGVSKQEGFECECCGAMEEPAPTGTSGCNSGCNPLPETNIENNPGQPQDTGCQPNDPSANDTCGNNSASQSGPAKPNCGTSCCGY